MQGREFATMTLSTTEFCKGLLAGFVRYYSGIYSQRHPEGNDKRIRSVVNPRNQPSRPALSQNNTEAMSTVRMLFRY
jgi:hypothetical protein